jgi:hypothetical protein
VLERNERQDIIVVIITARTQTCGIRTHGIQIVDITTIIATDSQSIPIVFLTVMPTMNITIAIAIAILHIWCIIIRILANTKGYGRRELSINPNTPCAMGVLGSQLLRHQGC